MACTYQQEVNRIFLSPIENVERINKIKQWEYMQPLDVPKGFKNQPKPLSKKQKAKLKTNGTPTND